MFGPFSLILDKADWKVRHLPAPAMSCRTRGRSTTLHYTVLSYLRALMTPLTSVSRVKTLAAVNTITNLHTFSLLNLTRSELFCLELT